MDTPGLTIKHLTDAELCALAIPAAGVPEALPAHLSDCLACSRALSEWKVAMREIRDDSGPLDRRTSEEWAEAEDRTIELVRGADASRPRLRLGWALGIAASLLVAVLLVPMRRAYAPEARTPERDRGELSKQDQADDALLRDVARMSRGDDDAAAPWDALAPEPGSSAREGTL